MNLFVTGASRGLGLELIKIGLKQGNFMLAGWLGAPEDPSELEALAAEYPGMLELIQIDVTSEQSVMDAAKQAERLCPALDGIVNNAGVLFEKMKVPGDPITDLDIDMLRKTIEVNTVGPAIVLKYFMPLAYLAERPCIINITSEAGHLDAHGYNYLAYSVSKHGANMYTQKIRNYLAEQELGVRIFMMHPGRMNTVMGKENAQMEPSESAEGIYKVLTGELDPQLDIPFINYKGEQMPY